MQIIEVYLAPGEGETAARIVRDLEVRDFNLMKSETGDLLIVKHPLDKTDSIIDKLREEFDFEGDDRRSIIISRPDAIYPREEDKEKKTHEKYAKECIIEYAEQNSYADSKFLALFFFSAVVATMGLITNNIAVLVGAMIIAPAFGPISSVAVGAVVNRMDLFKDGIKAELMGMLLAVATAAAMGFLLPGVELTPELQTKMLPTIFDLFIGLAAGAAGGYVLVSGRGSSIVGVMIAAALLPVMCGIGLGVVFLNPFVVFGGFLLLIITMLAIVLSMVVVFWFVGPQREHIHLAYDYHITQDTVSRIVRYGLVLIVILTIPLIWFTYENIVTSAPAKEISKVFSEPEYQDLGLGDITIQRDGIHVVVYDFGVDNEAVLAEVYWKIKSRIDPRYRLEFNVVKALKRGYGP